MSSRAAWSKEMRLPLSFLLSFLVVAEEYFVLDLLGTVPPGTLRVLLPDINNMDAEVPCGRTGSHLINCKTSSASDERLSVMP